MTDTYAIRELDVEVILYDNAGAGYVDYKVWYMANKSSTKVYIYAGRVYTDTDEASVYPWRIWQNYIGERAKDWVGFWAGNQSLACGVDYADNTEAWRGTITAVWQRGADADAWMNAPITGEVDTRQLLFITSIKRANTEISLNINGKEKQVFTDWWTKAGTYGFNLSECAEGDILEVIKIEDEEDEVMAEYKVVAPCHKWAVYYINQYGGQDSLLLKGVDKRTDTYERTSILTGGLNPSGRVVQIATTETWEIRTGYLSDEQAGRMYHLLSSPSVILHNLQTGEDMPVRVTNSQCEHKTYKGEGRKLVEYALTFEVLIEDNRRQV